MEFILKFSDFLTLLVNFSLVRLKLVQNSELLLSGSLDLVNFESIGVFVNNSIMSWEVFSFQRWQIGCIVFNCKFQLMKCLFNLVVIEIWIATVQIIFKNSVWQLVGLNLAFGLHRHFIETLNDFSRFAKVFIDFFDCIHNLHVFLKIDFHFLNVNFFFVTFLQWLSLSHIRSSFSILLSSFTGWQSILGWIILEI